MKAARQEKGGETPRDRAGRTTAAGKGAAAGLHRRFLLVLLFLAVQAGLTFRVFNPAPHSGGDNAAYLALAYSLAERGTYQELWTPGEPPHTKYPPVFPLVLSALMSLGVKGWTGFKGVSVAATLAAGVFTLLWAWGRGGPGLALATAFLFALSDAVLDYSRWILSDALFVALTLGALWALERGWRRGNQGRGVGWWAVGVGLTAAAYLTRSAGLPLVAAVLLWLGWRRKWSWLSGSGLALGLPLLAWWWWSRWGGRHSYMSEFWLRDPYQPELGTVGLGGLLARGGENLWAYVTALLPEGVVGMEGPWLLPLGVLMVGGAAWGWLASLRRGAGVAEFFFPLYAGLILLWPQVWSGDRFALPLIPLVLWYGGRALTGLFPARRTGWRWGVGGVGVLVVGLLAFGNWMEEGGRARECARAVGRAGPWACYGPGVQEFAALSAWTREHLPDGASVVARKPTIFYVLSGIKAKSLPLTLDPDTFLAEAQEGGTGYVVLDRWDALAGFYLGRALRARPSAFCVVTAVGSGDGEATYLLGFTEPSPEAGGEAGPGEGSLSVCGPSFRRNAPRSLPPIPPGAVPLLVLGEAG